MQKLFSIAGTFNWGQFISKGPRFVAHVNLNGIQERCYLPNPGRMKELLYENRPVLLRKNIGSQYKTKYTLVATALNPESIGDTNVELVNLDTHIPIPLAIHEFTYNKQIDIFKKHSIIKCEPKIGNSRLDLLLEDIEGRSVYCELKSTTKIQDKIGYFPDAISTRASNHLKLLSKLVLEGKKGLVLFIAQMADVKEIRPDKAVDPVFAKTVNEVLNDNLSLCGIATRSWLNQERTRNGEIIGTIYFQSLKKIPFNPL